MRVKHKILLSTLSILILVMPLISGCFGGTAISRGWAGGAVLDDTLFVASMTGKVIAIDAATGTILGTPIQLSIPSSGGFLGCSSSSSPLVIYASPVVLNQMVYVGGNDGKIHGYPFTENALHENPSSHSDYTGGLIIGELVLANTTIYFASSNGTIHALNTHDLNEVWSFETGSKIWSAPVVDGDTLYIGSLDKKIYALNTSDGTEKWNYPTSGAINSAPIVYDNKVYIGDYDRHFYALNAANGELVWEFPTADKGEDNPQNWFWAKPVIVNGIIYAPCLDGNVYALDAGNGNLVKKFVLGDSISSSPVVMGNSIIVATTDLYKKTSKVYIINTLDNSQQELESFNEGINAPLFVNNDVVYVHTTKDNLYGINILTRTKQTFSLSAVN